MSDATVRGLEPTGDEGMSFVHRVEVPEPGPDAVEFSLSEAVDTGRRAVIEMAMAKGVASPEVKVSITRHVAVPRAVLVVTVTARPAAWTGGEV